jgi:hypothetical protein
MSEGTAGWRLTRRPRWRHSRGGSYDSRPRAVNPRLPALPGLRRLQGSMKNSRRRQIGQNRRRGLAPVELVLALPVWMLLASAMVIVGNLGAWKIRGHVAVREAAVRSQWPRTRGTEANSTEWNRRSSIMHVRPASNPGTTDPLSGHPVIRGPQIGAPGFSAVISVDGEVMKTQSEAVAGEAFLNEPPAVWSKSGIRSRFAREFPVLNGNTGQWSPSASGTLRCQSLWDLPVLE